MLIPTPPFYIDQSPLRLERYALDMGAVTLSGNGPLTLCAMPRSTFRMDRLIIRAETGRLPWLVTFVCRWFAWIQVPWLFRHWDDDTFKIRMIHPTRILWCRIDQRMQRKALESCVVEDIRVGNQGTFVSPCSGAVFSETAIGMQLRMPTCSPQQKIEVVLNGRGGPLQVMALGFMVVDPL